MDGLDFSSLTDDQLVELARLCCVEAVRRNPAVSAAMSSMMLDEAERVRVAKAAMEGEAAAMRARERERIAREAAAAVRAAEEARTAEARRKAGADAVARERQAAEQQQFAEMAVLRQASALVGRSVSDISLLYVETRFGRRVMINVGADRYSRDHMMDYNCVSREIRTTQALVKRKPDLIAFAIEFAAAGKVGRHLVGSAYPWPDTSMEGSTEGSTGDSP